MRELRNIKDKRVIRKKKGMMPWLILFILAGVVAGTAIIYVISKQNQVSVVRELPSGSIYTQKGEGETGMLSGQGKDLNSGKDKKTKEEPEANPESFTFYKVLSSKDKEIVPLTGGNLQKTGDQEMKFPVQEKIQGIEKEIDPEVVMSEKKDDLYTVQVSALSQESKANELVARLKQLGYVSYIHRKDEQGGKRLHKVRIGKFASAADAQEVAKLLKKDGYETYVVKAE